MRLLALLTLSLAAPALAQEDAGDPAAADAGVSATDAGVAATDAGLPADTTIFVMGLEANPAAAQYAPTTTQTLAFRMGEAKINVLTQTDIAAALGRERQAQLLGCTETGCMAELGQAMGARYIVSGRLDKVGDQFVLVASLFDSVSSRALGRTRQETDELDRLPASAKAAGETLLGSLGLSAPAALPPPAMRDSGFNLSFKLGTQFFTSLAALTPQLELEFGWRFNRAWSAFLQISAGIAFTEIINFTVTPGLLGARYNFRADASLQPFVGAGIGLFATLLNAGRIRPSVVILGGAQYFFWDNFGLSAEASVDVLGAAFEFTDQRTGGINFGLSLGLIYRF